MKLAIALSFASLALGSAVKRGDCHSNNCNRAVMGTRPGLPEFEQRSRWCSAFVVTTVTPAATTVTVTVEEDVVPTPAKRDEVPPVIARQATALPTGTIPAYADNCVNAAEYSTACGCLGVTPTVVTVATPTVTVTTTLDYCDDL